MTHERWLQLSNEPDDEQAILTPSELYQGWHWCHEFDGLLVGPGMGELNCCTCQDEQGIPFRDRARKQAFKDWCDQVMAEEAHWQNGDGI